MTTTQTENLRIYRLNQPARYDKSDSGFFGNIVIADSQNQQIGFLFIDQNTHWHFPPLKGKPQRISDYSILPKFLRYNHDPNAFFDSGTSVRVQGLSSDNKPATHSAHILETRIAKIDELIPLAELAKQECDVVAAAVHRIEEPYKAHFGRGITGAHREFEFDRHHYERGKADAARGFNFVELRRKGRAAVLGRDFQEILDREDVMYLNGQAAHTQISAVDVPKTLERLLFIK